MKVIFLCCVTTLHFLIAFGTPVQNGDKAGHPCGHDKNNNLIYAGKENYPYVVRLEIERDEMQDRRCGGSILSGKVVLTAAHCLKRKIPKSKLEVWVAPGVINLEKERIYWHKMYDYLIHEEYTELKVINNKPGSEQHVQWPNDIALIWVGKRFEYSLKVNQIEIMSPNINIMKKLGFILGWGDTEECFSSDILLRGNLRVIPKSECEHSKNGIQYHLSRRSFCIRSDYRKQHIGVGDSGGPFVIGNKLVGVISNSFAVEEILASGEKFMKPDPTEGATMTDARFYAKWISDNSRLGPPKDRKKPNKPPTQQKPNSNKPANQQKPVSNKPPTQQKPNANKPPTQQKPMANKPATQLKPIANKPATQLKPKWNKPAIQLKPKSKPKTG